MAETASYNGVTRRFQGDSFFMTSHRKFCHVADRVLETLALAILILFFMCFETYCTLYDRLL